MIRLFIVLIYASFVLDFLVWPISSEASTLKLVHNSGSGGGKIVRIVLFLNNLIVYLYPLVVTIFFFDTFEVEPTHSLILFGMITMSGRVITLKGAHLLYHQTDRLITSSVFRLSRNPITLGVHLTVLGMILIYPVWWILVLYVIMLIDMDHKIRREEDHLISTYGDAYREFIKTTPRYVFR